MAKQVEYLIIWNDPSEPHTVSFKWSEVLENALYDFNGTVLVISHDRYFLDRTVSRVFALEDGSITEHIGGYSDYAARAGVVFNGQKAG